MFLNSVSSDAPWLWAEGEHKANQWAMFRAKLDFDGKKATAIIAADTKYYLYINGKLVIFEGGLNRGPVPGGTYADRVDLSEHLVPGENTLAALVWYWGNEGRNNVDSGCPGFYFVMEDGTMPSFRAMLHPAYGQTLPPYPAYLYGGHNIGFDARLDVGDFAAPDFDDSSWAAAVEVPGTPLYARPVPAIRFSNPKPYPEVVRQGNRYVAKLPYGAQLTPIFTVRAPAGCRIDVRTDHYVVPGGPGDDHHVYNGHRVEYITREGLQSFEGLNWLYGERVIYRMDPQVEMVELAWRETGFDTQVTARFESRNSALNRLVEKAQRTLLVCMRDNFMDCPDRERGQWIGDVSVQAPQALMSLDENAAKLMKKAIFDFILLRKGDTLVGNVPGIHCSELPSQSLCAISKMGMLAWYTRVTGDTEPLELAYPAMEAYLKLWRMQDNGLVEPRKGNWYWFDHGAGVDGPVLENAWYYNALEYYLETAARLEKTPDPDLTGRKEIIAAAFERHFRHEDGYRSGGKNDDRANAMAVLTGLAAKEMYPVIAQVLDQVRLATPYMEAFVLDALFAMDEGKLALRRMMERYSAMAKDPGSTLWEDFDVLGTRNHAWSGAPLTVAFRHLAGLEPNGQGGWMAHPAVELMDELALTMQTKQGEITVGIKAGKAYAHGPVQLV